MTLKSRFDILKVTLLADSRIKQLRDSARVTETEGGEDKDRERAE